MSLVALVSGNLLRHPFFTAFRRPPKSFNLVTSRGTYQQDSPLPFRAACLFLGLLAFAEGKPEVSLPTARILRALNYKLYNQDLAQLLERLAATRLSFEGSFYEKGRFVTRKNLRLIEDFDPPGEGRPLRVVFSRWVQEGVCPVDVGLFRILSPFEARLYLYFNFALRQGPFFVSVRHLGEILPLYSRGQRRTFEETLDRAMENLSRHGVLSFEAQEEGFFVRPGPHLEALGKTPLPFERPREITPKGIVFVGPQHSGKSTILRRLHRRAAQKKTLKPLYLPCLFSLTDWLHWNFSPEEIKGLSAVERRRLLVSRAQESYLLVDDLERASGQKAQVVKECLRKAPRFAVTTRDLRLLPDSLRLTLERRGFREVSLKSAATKDLSFAFLACLVIIAALFGHHEWVLGLIAARLFLRQPL